MEQKLFYKLVSQDHTTFGGMKWAIGVTNKATNPGNRMCTNQVLHCYSDPRLAVIFNPIHAGIKDPLMYAIECSPIVNTDGLKYACKEQTPRKLVPLPPITLTQKVAFAIKCALLVCQNQLWVSWAERWLSGEDRGADAARAAACAADYATRAARAAAHAARAADYADAGGAAAAYAAYAADYAARAAHAAAHAARAADYADAGGAAAAAGNADAFIPIIDWVMENIE